jgi:hypothetical protein
VFTSDPSICTNAIQIPNLTFDEATELAYSGAQVFTFVEINLFIEISFCLNDDIPGCSSIQILHNIF